MRSITDKQSELLASVLKIHFIKKINKIMGNVKKLITYCNTPSSETIRNTEFHLNNLYINMYGRTYYHEFE
jgi:hypothetical protein